MRRKRMLAAIMPLLMFSLALAQAPSNDAATQIESKYALLEKVDVMHGPDGLRLEIKASGTLSPQAALVSNPDRLVIDLPEVVVSRFRSITVGNEGVRAVRIGQNNAHPPVARVVVDLVRPQAYELVPEGDKLVINLRPDAAPQTVAARSATPEASTALQKKAETPKLTAPPPQRNVEVNSRPLDTQNGSAAAKDYVFVEPSYNAKPALSTARPPQRTLEAAATMAATRPESLLVPRESASFSQVEQAQHAPAANSTPAQASEPAASNTPAQKPAVNMAAEQQQQMSQGMPAAGKSHYTGEPISVNLKDVDLKDFFRLIHEISGLNIVLDPNVHGSLTIVLDDVPWDQALDIVLKNNGLDRQLEGNVLRIATVDTLRKEAEARRGQIEAEALAVDKITVTRFLSYAHSKDVVPTLKKLLSSRGDIISDDRTNALIIQDIPAVIPELDRLIAQLDRKTQEVEIEARVVAATRSFARDIGTQLGVAFGNNASSLTGAAGSLPATIAGK